MWYLEQIRLGDVLIDFGYITQDQLQAALAYQKEHKNLRVGQALQELGFYVNERQVLEALAQRLQLWAIDFTDQRGYFPPWRRFPASWPKSTTCCPSPSTAAAWSLPPTTR